MSNFEVRVRFVTPVRIYDNVAYHWKNSLTFDQLITLVSQGFVTVGLNTHNPMLYYLANIPVN